MSKIAEDVQYTGTTRIRPDPNVLAQRLEDELVVIHLTSNEIYQLNRTAARLWELLESGLDLDQAKRHLTEEFDVPAEELEADVSDILASLINKQLVQVKDER